MLFCYLQAKQLVQIVIQGATVVGRAFAQALRQEIRYSQEAAQRAGGGESGRKAAQSDLYHGMTLQVSVLTVHMSSSEFGFTPNVGTSYFCD